MTIFAVEYVLWGTGLFCYGALALTMYHRGLCSQSPVFSAWIFEMFVSALLLIPISRLGSYQIYAIFYWLFTVLELSLQVGTAVEFASQAMCDRGIWLKEARRFIVIGFTLAVILSCFLTFLASPAANEGLDVFYVRVELFTSLLTLFLTLITLACSERYGGVWTKTQSLSFFGFVIFACTSALTDSLHTWWRTEATFLYLEVFRMVLSQAILIYWLLLRCHSVQQLSGLERNSLDQLESVYKVNRQQHTGSTLC